MNEIAESLGKNPLEAVRTNPEKEAEIKQLKETLDKIKKSRIIAVIDCGENTFQKTDKERETNGL